MGLVPAITQTERDFASPEEVERMPRPDWSYGEERRAILNQQRRERSSPVPATLQGGVSGRLKKC